MSEKLDRRNWRIASFSSEETNGELGCGRAESVIDGNTSTYWHSRWTSEVASYPHFLVIDLGATQYVHRFSIAQRRNLCRAIKNLDLLKSLDGIEFSFIGSYVLENTDGTQIFEFSETENVRFLKLVANTSWDGEPYAALADVNLYQNKSGRVYSASGEQNSK